MLIEHTSAMKKASAIKKGDCMLCHAGGSIAYSSSQVQPWSLYWGHFDLANESPLLSFLYSEEINPRKPVVNIQNELAIHLLKY